MKMRGIATTNLLFCRNWCFWYDCGKIKHAILPQLIFLIYLRQNSGPRQMYYATKFHSDFVFLQNQIQIV